MYGGALVYNLGVLSLVVVSSNALCRRDKADLTP